jgi:hypothetical protein
MTRQTEYADSLVGSSTGIRISRVLALTATAIMAVGSALSGFSQQRQAAQPEAAKPAAEKKPAAEPKDARQLHHAFER